MQFDNTKIGCAIIKAEKKDDKPIKTGDIKDGLRFKVHYKEVEDMVNFINQTLTEFGMNNYFTYITTFDLVKEYDICTKERIVEMISQEAAIQNQSQEKSMIKTR